MAKAKRSDIGPALDSEGAPILTFRDMPPRKSYFVEEFFAHVKKTGRPETFQGLHPGPIDKNEPFRRIAPIEIDGRRRPDGSSAPCPMCHHPNKFLKGWLVHLPNPRAVAAIGCECADKETLAAADREYKARCDREQEEDYLLAHMPLIQAQLALIASLHPVAAEALRVYRLFRGKGDFFHRQLRDVNQRGGQLTVSEEIIGDLAAIGPRGFQGTSGGSTRDIVFGPLAGTTALIGDFNPLSELNRIAVALRHHDKAATEDAALEYIVTLDPIARHRAYVELTEAAKAYEKFRGRLADFVAFFAPDNVNRVRAWASHVAHPQPFEVLLTTQAGNTIISMRRAGDYFRVALGSSLRTVIQDWPKQRGSRQ